MATSINQEKSTDFTDGLPVPGDARIEPILNAWDIKWGGALGTGVALTYSFPGSGSAWRSSYSADNEPGNMARFNADLQDAFTDALQAWANVADITFLPMTDSTGNVDDVAVIRAAFYKGIDGGAAGWGYLPGFFANAGDVWLNPVDFTDPGDYAPGTYGFLTLMHEIGHALGLSHPNDNGLAPGFDNRTTIMSYNEHPRSLFRQVTDTGNGEQVNWIPIEPDTPMPRDILAIQYLYGANMAYAAGDDVYTFDPATPFIRTIWDAGGEDTIDVSNFTRGCRIDLVAGRLSDILIPSDPRPEWLDDEPGGIYNGRQNLAIAYNVTIENATGGSGNDKLLGNGASNTLLGGAGKDRLNGKGGTDHLAGGEGDDVYTIDDASEIDQGLGDPGIDLVKAKVSYTLGEQQENLKLVGMDAIDGTGNPFSNTITGNDAANTLDGSGGDDVVAGGLGKDVLTGGSGVDVFLFDVKAGNRNADQITDFTPGVDVIHLSAATFVRLKEVIRGEADDGPVVIRSGEFLSSVDGVALEKDDRIIYNETTGVLYYDPDGNGAQSALKIATLAGAPEISFDDILVVPG